MIEIKRYYKAVLIALAIGLVIGLTSLYILFFTTLGSKFIVKLQLAKYSQYKNISIGKIEGSLSRRVIIHDLKLGGLKNFPAGSVLQIQSLWVRIGLFTKKLDAELKNGVFKTTDSDAVYFSGTCNDGILSLDLKGDSFDLRELTGLLPEELAATSMSGVLKDIKISITGDVSALNVNGKLGAKNVHYNDLIIEKCSSIILNLTLRSSDKKGGVKGDVTIKDASIGLKNYPNIVIMLEAGSAVFPGDGSNDIALKTIRGKLKLPNSESILFDGSYQNALLDLGIYSNTIDLKDAINLLEDKKGLAGVSGIVKSLDIRIKGTLLEQAVTGTFRIAKIIRQDFSISDCPGVLALRLKIVQKAIVLSGEIILNSGTVSGPKTAIIALQKSKILFDGDSKNPALNIRGNSTVNGTNIDIALTGMLDKPDIVLKSVPSMPEERLMLMVATGKNWTGAEDALSKGKISPDLAKDFVSYFVFSDPENSMGKKFGLDNFSIKYDDKTQGASVKKDITDKTLLSYGVEQPKEPGKEKEITHRIGVEQKLTDNISLSGKRELTQGSKTDGKDAKPNDEVVVKYKATF